MNNLLPFPARRNSAIDAELPQGMVTLGAAAASLVEKLRRMRAENAHVIPFTGSRIKGPPLKRTARP
jgi:hypothetical protein